MTQCPAYFDVDKALSMCRDAPYDLEFVSITGSTNDDLKLLARDYDSDRIKVRFAFQQTAGRGVNGHTWDSDKPSYLFSMLTPLPRHYPYLALPMAIGLSVATVLRKAHFDVFLKWPNDIFVDGGKAGGVLCERCRNKRGEYVIVAGVGINLIKQEGVTTNGWRRSGLYDREEELEANTITDLFLELLNQIVTNFNVSKEVLFPHWKDYDFFYGQMIYFDAGDRIVHGKCLGIDDTARIVLETPEGLQAFSSGSIITPKLANWKPKDQ